MKEKPNLEREFEAFLKTFGKKVKEVRTQKQRTQEWMDDKQDFGIDIKHFQSIEQGRSNVTLRTIFKVCRKLGVQPSDLFKGVSV